MAAHAERNEVAEFFEANAAFHAHLVAASGNGKLQRALRTAARPDGPLPDAVADAARQPAAIGRRARGDPPCARRRGDAERAAQLMAEHIRVPQRRLEGARRRRARRRRGDRRRERPPLEFGVNLNNREPLIAPDYDLPMLLDLSRDRRGGRVRLGLGRRQPVLEAPLRADLAAVGDLAAHLAGQARHGLHGLVDPKPALPRARVGDARRDLGRADDPRHRHGQPRGGRPARVRGARPRLRQTRHAVRGRARRAPRSSGPRDGRTSTARTSTTTTSRSSRAPRWRR